MSSWRAIGAVALGVLLAACAVYWFTIGRRPLDAGGAEQEQQA